MSGHSKWSTIKRQKAVTDSRRSAVFTKLGRLIAVAAREGGKDPMMNFKLRLAIDKAKAASMPKENIDRAIKSGAGELRGDTAKEVVYEGFGPGQVAVMVQALTDNTNRTAAEMRALFQKFGGTLGSQNSVGWMFKLQGVARIPLSALPPDRDAFELALVDAGADDLATEGEQLVVTADPAKAAAVRQAIEAAGVSSFEADTELVPQSLTGIDAATQTRLYEFFDALEEHPDVTNFFSNES